MGEVPIESSEHADTTTSETRTRGILDMRHSTLEESRPAEREASYHTLAEFAAITGNPIMARMTGLRFTGHTTAPAMDSRGPATHSPIESISHTRKIRAVIMEPMLRL